MESKDRQQQYLEFALGTLEGEECEDIRSLLAQEDPECTRGVAEARALVSTLAYAAPDTAPPATLKKRLLESVAEPRGSRGRMPNIAWAVAAGLLVFAVLADQRTRGLREELTALQQRFDQLSSDHNQLLAETETYRQAMAVVSTPGTRAVSLSAPQSPELQAYWNEPLGRIVLAGQNVPAPASDRTLQLWIIPKQGNPIDAGIFRPDETGRALHLASPAVPISQAAALAITDEPAGGQPQPTATPIWVGQIG